MKKPWVEFNNKHTFAAWVDSGEVIAFEAIWDAASETHGTKIYLRGGSEIMVEDHIRDVEEAVLPKPHRSPMLLGDEVKT